MALQVGAAAIDITPHLGCHLDGNLTDRTSKNLHDPLLAQAVVFDNGQTRLGIVLSDLIIVSRQMADEVKERVAAAADIPPENLLVTATHTHYGPAVAGALETPREDEYVAWVPRRIADAVIQATRSLQPAQLGWGVGACPTEVHNRRWKMKDGSVKMNPGAGNPNLVEPAGPTDPALPVLIARTPERRPIAALANLGLHYVGSANEDVSADYFGYFRRGLNRCAGAEFPALLTNGCFGDINNVNVRRPGRSAPHPYHHTERVANVVAGEAWKVWNTLWEEDFHADVPLGAALEMVEFRPRRPTPEQIVEARAYLAAHTMAEDPWRYIYAQEHSLMEHWPERIELPIQAIRLGEFGIVGLPGEVFSEIGLGIKAASPYPVTAVVGLANATVGYVAPDHQIDWGGYETTLCRHVTTPKGTAQHWTATALRLLGDLRKVG